MSESVLKTMQHYCAYQERCHSEVRYKLLELNVRGEALERIMAALIEEDFLNEERYARAYAGGKFRIKHWGRKKITQELKQKQVSDYCIRKGLTEIEEQEYLRAINRLIEKKSAELKTKEPDWIRKQKIYRYLLQKGYEPELIGPALDH